MPKIKVHFYGLIKEDFFIQEFEMDSPYTLGDLEKDIVGRYGNNINNDYKSSEGFLNHKLVRVGDVSGKRLDDLNTDISGLSEIWFIIPFSGG